MAEVMTSVSAKEREDEQLEAQRLIQVARRKQNLSNVTPFFGLMFIILFFSVVTGSSFLTATNLANLINQCFNLIIVAIGVSFVFAHGGMDMSIGAVVAVSSLAGAFCWITPGVPMIVGFVAAIVVGMLCGLAISCVNVYARVPVFVVSLCIKYICTGIITTAVSQSDMFINYAAFKYLNSGIIKTLVILAVVAIGYYVFEYTRVGKDLKAVGGNKTMAFQSGVKVNRSIITAFLISGAMMGVVAMFGVARVGTVTAQTGMGLEFDAMTAIVLGGFPMQGGSRAKIRSAIIGALTVSVLTNGLTLWGVDPSLIYGIKGLLFLAIVGLSYERKKGEVVA